MTNTPVSKRLKSQVGMLMIVYLHGFDWITYAEQVMPAFAHWLLTKDESGILPLFEHTRCPQEEQFLPTPMQHLRTWTRAQVFVEQLPRGAQSQNEYEQLCSAEQFTALNDRYLHHHMPQLYQNSEALRILWGAIIEAHCLPWRHMALHGKTLPFLEMQASAGEMTEDAQEVRGELVSLLQAAGLTELALEVDEQIPLRERSAWEPIEVIPPANYRSAVGGEKRAQRGVEPHEVDGAAVDDDLAFATELGGIEIGGASDLLHLRGWLASISLRAMVLFEYLASGRRVMPFGSVTGEPYSYCGYLTPDEVQQLAACLHCVQPPARDTARQDQQHFHRHLTFDTPSQNFRLLDEVLPFYAAEFLQAVRAAATADLGLICSTE